MIQLAGELSLECLRDIWVQVTRMSDIIFSVVKPFTPYDFIT
jgi:hypothetical protein